MFAVFVVLEDGSLRDTVVFAFPAVLYEDYGHVYTKPEDISL